MTLENYGKLDSPVEHAGGLTCHGKYGAVGRLKRLLLSAALCLAVGITFVLLDLPGEGRLVHALQNAGHGLAFAALTFTLPWLLGIHRTKRPVVLVAKVSFFLFAMGIGIEIAQHMTGRGATAADLYMNFAGIVAGGALSVASLSRHSDGNRNSTMCRGTAVGVSCLAFVWCLRFPMAIVTVDALAPSLPILADFEQSFALAKFAEGSNPASLSLTSNDPRWLSNPTRMLKAVFPSGVWPGFRLVEPPADWRRFNALAIRVANLTKKSIRLNVRIDQRAAGENIFWTASTSLDPGVNDVRIKLGSMSPDVALEVARADHEPFAAVYQVLFFLAGSQAETVLLFDDLTLVR